MGLYCLSLPLLPLNTLMGLLSFISPYHSFPFRSSYLALCTTLMVTFLQVYHYFNPLSSVSGHPSLPPPTFSSPLTTLLLPQLPQLLSYLPSLPLRLHIPSLPLSPTTASSIAGVRGLFPLEVSQLHYFPQLVVCGVINWKDSNYVSFTILSVPANQPLLLLGMVCALFHK